jgi:hypothetical protein
MEYFWCLLGRCLNGTYVSVQPFHLLRHVNAQTFRYNERHGVDSDRFRSVLENPRGRRSTFAEVKG